jgi:hypothetical protein
MVWFTRCLVIGLAAFTKVAWGRQFLRPTRNTYNKNIVESRGLQDETVDPLRRFVSDVAITIPDMEVSEKIGFGNFTVFISDFRCFDLTYTDVSVQSVVGKREDEGAFRLDITEVLFKCTMGLKWEYGWQDGEGTVYVESNENYLSATASNDPATDNEEEEIESKRRRKEEERNCEGTEIDLETLEFDGSFSLQVLNLARGFIRRVAERKLEETFCELMRNEMLGRVVNTTQEKLSLYTSDLPEWRSDPLYLQNNNTIFPSGEKLINLQNDAEAGDLVHMALNNINQVYAIKKYDENATTPDKMDYGVNTILREKILQPDGSLLVVQESDNETFFFSSPLVDVNITIHSARLWGLDTAVVTSPVTVLGSETIQNQLFWNNNTIEMDLTIVVGASTSNVSIFENAAEVEPIVERVTASMGAGDIQATFSLMVPLDRNMVNELPIGYITNWQDLPRCIPPVFFNITLSGMDVQWGKIFEPTFTGFQSQEIEQIVRSSIQVGLASFQGSILEAVPGFFQTEARDTITADLLEDRFCPVEDAGTARRMLLEVVAADEEAEAESEGALILDCSRLVPM